ncbi:indolepyruvate ferredoxin oxidoreductase subunit alpha [Bacillota bacterium LX-D]|nr:indolepyruvate ferredoxin oxidoreductase subunit alpha [Bacillota bacterium LX-D]
MKKLLMGNEAIAYGALEASIDIVTGYPGTPSTEIFTTLAELAPAHQIKVQWSVNEKVALEVAAGAAYTGARALVTMKQVGLNVAADPLMTLAYIGVKGGLVIAVADDPGPHSSQNEQDTRKFAAFAKLPVLDPSTPQEAKDMVKAAFVLSEELGLPVILRPTTRTCHSCQDVEIEAEISRQSREKTFIKDPGWVILPGLALKKHAWLNAQQEKAAQIFTQSSFNSIKPGQGTWGIITGGVSYSYVQEAMQALGLDIPVLKVGTPYPLPTALVQNFLQQVQKVLVIEEQEPVIEDQVLKIIALNKYSHTLRGKHDGLVPREGEFNVDKVLAVIAECLDIALPEDIPQAELPALPQRPPILCAGCPHRASFYEYKKAAQGKNAIFTGDIGCYTLGFGAPLDAVDTCLCMGASISMGTGLNLAEPERKIVAFLGDSTFFHTGIPGLINAVHNQAQLTLVVLDNRTTAMTGHQTNPGLGKNAAGQEVEALDITQIAKACGAKFVATVDPYDYKSSLATAKEALDFPGVSVVVMQRECIAVTKQKNLPLVVDREKCINCGVCIEKLGCPALAQSDHGPIIGDSCNGCTLCSQICPAHAILIGGAA